MYAPIKYELIDVETNSISLDLSHGLLSSLKLS